MLQAAVHVTECTFGLVINGACNSSVGFLDELDVEHAATGRSDQPVDDASARLIRQHDAAAS